MSRSRASLCHKSLILKILAAVGITWNVYLFWPANVTELEELSVCRNNAEHNTVSRFTVQRPLNRFTERKDVIISGKENTGKVLLSVGLLCCQTADGGKQAIDGVRSIVKLDKNRGKKQGLVVVILLTDQDESRLSKVTSKLESNLKDLVDDGYIQIIRPPKDFYRHIVDYAEKTAKWHINLDKKRQTLNLNLAFLVQYCIKLSHYFLLYDELLRPKPEALDKIYEHISGSEINQYRFVSYWDGFIARLYHEVYLERLARHLYFVNSVQDTSSNLATFHFASQSAKILAFKPSLFEMVNVKSDWKNPEALIAVTMTVYDTFVPLNVYEQKGIFWAISPKKGQTFVIIIRDPHKLQRIAIESGKDNYLSDALSRAVLELSYANTKSKEEETCSSYNVVASFQETTSVDLVYNEQVQNHPLKNAVKCIRIRITEDEPAWVALKSIIVEERKTK